jgi:oligopeptidase B
MIVRRRIMRQLRVPVLLYILLAITLPLRSAAMAQNGSAVPTPPVAKKAPRTSVLHGDKLVDNYFWLREKSDPEVIAYLESENAYAAAMMKGTEGLQQALYKEMLGRIKETDLSVPYRQGEYFYYSRTEEGKQYPIHCRKRGGLDAKEEVTLDLNELAKGHKFLGLGAYAVSDDGNLLAYSTDVTGFRQYTLHVKDLRTGELLPDRREKTVSVLWAADNKTLFYTTEDHAKRPYRFYRHVLGGQKDDLVYEEKDELYRIIANRSRDRRQIFLTSASSVTSEVRHIPADRPAGEAKLILPREAEHEYYVDHRDGLFYIRTNKNAKTYRIVTAPVSDPQPSRWKEFIPHRKDVMLEGVDLFARHAVIYERENGLQQLNVIDMRDGKSHRLEMTEPVYSVFPSNNLEFNTTVLRFQYQSLVTPNSVFDYGMESRKRTLLKQTEVLGGYKPSEYASERIHATASDGTRVPISLVYKKGMKRDGASPMLLYGYGSYGSSLSPAFSSSRLSLLDRGVVYAMAHIRGGGDLGQEWHDQGKMMMKRNTFTDFITAAEHLIAQKYTSKDRLVIQGGSAGGLLMGAVTNMRPDLFKAVVSQVPFVDVINTMMDASLPLTVGEYLEWGNPNKKEEYEYMKSYCPYTNLAAKDYPAILVKTSLNDSQVMYWEPAKYVAKLRTLKTDKNPLVFKINMAAGHGGSSGRYDALREVAFDYAFILAQLGINQ